MEGDRKLRYEDYSWSTGDGLMGVDDPAVVAEAFDRGEKHAGIALVGLALSFEEIEPISGLIPRAVGSGDAETRRLGFLALAHTARLFGRMTPRMEVILRRHRKDPAAEIAVDDALSFIPFRGLPMWLRGIYIMRTVRWNLFERWRT